MLDGIQAWLGEHRTLAWVIVGVSALTAVVAVVALPVVIAALPANYFSAKRRAPGRFAEQHPAVRWTFRVLKNGLGVVLLVAGVAMLALPGQGLLTIIAGLILVEFPGKRRLERAIVRRGRVMRAMNWVRGRVGKEPFRPVR